MTLSELSKQSAGGANRGMAALGQRTPPSKDCSMVFWLGWLRAPSGAASATAFLQSERMRRIFQEPNYGCAPAGLLPSTD